MPFSSGQHAHILEEQHAQLGHVLDCVADALAADARVLDAAVGLRIDAHRGHVADDHAADVAVLPRVDGLVEVGREEADMDAELGVVDRRDRRLVRVRVRLRLRVRVGLRVRVRVTLRVRVRVGQP